MTLSTDFVIRGPVPKPREVWEFCQTLLTDDVAAIKVYRDDMQGKYDRNPGWGNELGQGLPALMSLEYGADGYLVKSCYCDTGEPDYTDTPCPGGSCDDSDEPDGFVKVNWDTTYGYRDDNGAGCGDLHAAYIDRLGAWCDARGLAWSWENEFTGEWHEGRDGLSELGDGGRAATHWFRTEALPAILAGGAS